MSPPPPGAGTPTFPGISPTPVAATSKKKCKKRKGAAAAKKCKKRR